MRTYFWRYVIWAHVIDDDGRVRQIFCGNAAEFDPADELAWEILNRTGTDPVEEVRIELHAQRVIAGKVTDLPAMLVQRMGRADIAKHSEIVKEIMVTAMTDEYLRAVSR